MIKALKKYSKLILESKYVFLINLSDRLFSFIIFLLIAREFSFENFGAIVTVFTISSILTTIFDLGLPVYLQRETAINKENASEIFSNIFTLYLLLSLPYLILVGIIHLVFFYYLSVILFAVIYLSMYISSLVNICNRSLSGKLDFKSQFLSFIISRSFIIIFFITGLYYLSFDLTSLLITILIGFILHLILSFWFLKSNNINFQVSRLKFKSIIIIINTTIPLGTAIIINFLYDKIDILLISKILDFSKVALYNVGYGIYKASTIAFSFILISGFSRVSSISRNKKAVLLFFKKYSIIIGLICILLNIFIFIFSKYIINVLYTSKFEESYIIVRILSFGLIALGLNNLTGIILNGIGLFKTVMYITLFGLLINIIINVAFIPLYGILAATVTTVITEYFILSFEFYYLYKVLSTTRKIK